MTLARPLSRPLTSALSRPLTAAGAGGGFAPLSLFANGEEGSWYDPSDFSSMFQDTAGTVPVTATGQSVARINDKSGNGYHMLQATPASRPVLQQDGNGNYYLDFDGADDFMSCAYTQAAYPLFLAAAAKSDVDVVGGVLSVTASTIVYHGIIKTATANAWAATDRNAGIVTDGATVVGTNTTAHVLMGFYTGTTVEARMDGQTNGTTASANVFGSGNTKWLGCLRSGSDFLNGRVYQSLDLARTPSASEVAALLAFFAARASVTL